MGRQEGRRFRRGRDVRSRGSLGQGQRDPQEGEGGREEGEGGREGARQGRESQGEEVEEVDGFSQRWSSRPHVVVASSRPHVVVASPAYSSFSPPHVSPV